MSDWREKMKHVGIDFGDGLPPLMDPRFADVFFLIFGFDKIVFTEILHEFVVMFGNVGLKPSAAETIVLTSDTAPGTVFAQWCEGWVLSRGDGHKWLHCMFTIVAGHDGLSDTDFRIHAATRASYGYKQPRCDRNISIQPRVK